MAKKHLQLPTQIELPVLNNPGNAKVFNKRPISDEPAAMQTKYYAKPNGKEIEIVKATPKALRTLVAGAVEEMGLIADWTRGDASWDGTNISYRQIKECSGYIPSHISADLIKRMITPIRGFIEKNDGKLELFLNEVERKESGKSTNGFSFSLVVTAKMEEGWREKINEIGKVLDGTGVTHIGMTRRLMFESDLGSVMVAFNIPFFKSCERSEP